MKGVILLDVTLNLWNAKYQPKTSLLYINILYNHPQIIIKNLPGNISKRINTLSADETRFNKFKDLYNALAIFAGIIKIITKSFKKIFKFYSRKVKRIRNYVSRCNLYLQFLIYQNSLISGEKMLMSSELRQYVSWFIYFFDLLDYCRICVTDFREGGPLRSPLPSVSCPENAHPE